jgi:hypothetical protein
MINRVFYKYRYYRNESEGNNVVEECKKVCVYEGGSSIHHLDGNEWLSRPLRKGSGVEEELLSWGCRIKIYKNKQKKKNKNKNNNKNKNENENKNENKNKNKNENENENKNKNNNKNKN